MAAQINAIGRKKLKLIKKIGDGGYSSVYQMAWKSKQGKIQVAAKKLIRNDKHELNIMSTLDHPNIVKLLGVVDEDMDFMLILELCEGGSLRSYLDNHKDKHFPEDEFFSWAKQAALPVKYLREMKIVHKDIKSPNYMIAANNVLKLGDFGLAKTNMASTKSKATESATYQWMAPELLRSGILSPSFDLFALAVVLWELWTRKFPFHGMDSVAVLWKVCEKDDRLPIPEDCPKWLADLMRQCWNTDYHKRPSIDQIIDVISQAASAAAAAVAAAAAKKSRQLQIINGPWKEERQFGQDRLSNPWGMAVNLNGDVAITDFRSAQVQLQVYSGDGKYRFSIPQGLEPGTTSHPHQVIINSDSNYFVTNLTKCVNKYDVNGRFKGQWVSSNPQSSSVSPSLIGLAIDSRGHILTGDISNMCINTHRQDGTYITSIKVGISPMYLGVTPQDTIIVAEMHTPPQIVSNTGQVLCTLNHPVGDDKWDPFGVYCYEDIIFISDWGTHTIICYSVSGEYLGSINLDIRYPGGISLTDNGHKLIVCCFSSGVKLYTRTKQL